MNILQIAGHMGSDPEVRFTPNGQKVTNFRMATNSRRGGKEETIWWRVTVWGDRFDKMMTFLKKGSSIIVIGEMQKPQMYTDRDGQTQVSLEITAEMIKFSPFGRSNQEMGHTQGGQAPMGNEQTFQPQQDAPAFAHSNQDEGSFDEDDPIPF